MTTLDLELDGGARQALRDALLSAFPGDALDTLAQVVFDRPLGDIAHGSGEAQAFQLIQQATAEGKLRRLIRQAELQRPNNRKLQEFIHHRLPFRPALMDRVPGLHGLLQQVHLPWQLLQEDYSQSVEQLHASLPDWALLPAHSRTLELLDALADLASSPGTLHPLLQFVVRLSRRPEARDFAPRFQEWLHAAAPLVKTTTSQLEAFQRGLDERLTSKPLYFLVKIDLWGEAPEETYTLGAWLMEENGEDCQVVFREDEARFPLSGLSEHLQTCLGNAFGHSDARLRARLQAARDALTFEFLLPRRLLSHPLEHVLIEEGTPEPIPLGTQFAVVVRPGDRLAAGAGSGPWRSWRNRWRAFQSDVASCKPALVLHLEETRQREFTLRFKDSNLSCLALAVPPPARPASSQPPEEDPLHRCVIKTGIPIALWVRECAALGQDQVRGKLEHLLSRLLELPRQVRREREDGYCQAESNPSHLGNHLTLLWDDPNRLPPELQDEGAYLAAPTPSK
jgi:hypothetical protein